MTDLRTDLRPKPTPTNNDGDDALTHYVCCCDYTTAFCGLKFDDSPGRDALPDDLFCAVCEDLWPDGTPCTRCGCEDC